jgi:phospholipid-translocating ATPase
MDQMKTHMNRYFLLIAILQLIPTITPVPPMTTWLPLGIVFTITAIKDGIDDIRRHKHDQAANRRLYDVLQSTGRPRVTQSQHIRVGDLVVVQVRLLVCVGLEDVHLFLPASAKRIGC